MRVFPFFLLLLLNGNLRAQVPPTVDPVEFCTEYEYLFRKQVSRFYPLPDSLIALFENDWDWRGLSANTDLEWTPEFIARYADKWVWHELLLNPGIVWTDSLIEQYRNRHDFRWYSLSVNPALPVSDSLLRRYAGQFVWRGLCKNPAFNRDKELASRYKNYCDALPVSEPEAPPPADRIDTYLEYGDAWKKRTQPQRAAKAIPLELDTIRHKNIQQLDLALLRKYPQAWEWYLLDRCPLLPWSPDLLADLSSWRNYTSWEYNTGIFEKIYAPFLSDALISTVMRRLYPPGQTQFFMLQEEDDRYGIIPFITTANGPYDTVFSTTLQFDRLSDSLPAVYVSLGGIYNPPLRFADMHGWGYLHPYRSAARIISPKVKSVLERFNIPPHRFHPVALHIDDSRYGRDTALYYVFHIAECDFQYLDYTQTSFYWSQVYFKSGRFIEELIDSLPYRLTAAQDYLNIRDSIRSLGSSLSPLRFEPREYIWKADFDIMACLKEHVLYAIWVSEDVKTALELAGVTGIKFEKVRAARPRMLGAETPEHRLRNADVLAAIKLDYATRPPEPAQRTVLNYQENCRWRDSVLAQKGIVRHLRKNQPLPETTDPVERKLREKELAWDVVLPDAYRKAVALMKFPRHKLPFLHYEFYHIDRVEQVGAEWHKNYPFTARAVLIAWNGVGDYLGFLLKPGSTYELDDTVYEFLHETGEVKPVGKL